MKFLTLYRYNCTELLTQGVLFIENNYVCDTLELPWKHNHREISCIPDGDYHIEVYLSAHFDEAILIKDVPQRDGILIHPANEVRELKGCIAPGVKSEDIVLHSRASLSKILDILGTDKGILEIKRM